MLQHGGVDSVSVVIERVFARREFAWSEAAGPLSWFIDQVQRVLEWLDGLRVTHPTGYVLIHVALSVLLVAILVHLGFLAFRSLVGSVAVTPDAAPHQSPRVEARDLEREARALAARGAYAEALGRRFHALLLALHEREVVSYHPAKTPAEYVAEAGLSPAGREALALLVERLYRHYFAGVPCGPDEWEAFAGVANQIPRYVASG